MQYRLAAALSDLSLRRSAQIRRQPSFDCAQSLAAIFIRSAGCPVARIPDDIHALSQDVAARARTTRAQLACPPRSLQPALGQAVRLLCGPARSHPHVSGLDTGAGRRLALTRRPPPHSYRALNNAAAQIRCVARHSKTTRHRGGRGHDGLRARLRKRARRWPPGERSRDVGGPRPGQRLLHVEATRDAVRAHGRHRIRSSPAIRDLDNPPAPHPPSPLVPPTLARRPSLRGSDNDAERQRCPPTTPLARLSASGHHRSTRAVRGARCRSDLRRRAPCKPM